jgi:hypothetical protein
MISTCTHLLQADGVKHVPELVGNIIIVIHCDLRWLKSAAKCLCLERSFEQQHSTGSTRLSLGDEATSHGNGSPNSTETVALPLLDLSEALEAVTQVTVSGSV